MTLGDFTLITLFLGVAGYFLARYLKAQLIIWGGAGAMGLFALAATLDSPYMAMSAFALTLFFAGAYVNLCTVPRSGS
jgi:hypothetical protein